MINTLFILDFFDRDAFVLINQRLASPAADSTMIALSNPYILVPLYVIFLGMALRKFKTRFYLPIVFIIIAFGLSDSISSKICKPFFQRVRPAFETSLSPRLPEKEWKKDAGGKRSLETKLPGSRFGFVSSHSANVFAVFLTASFVLGLSRRIRVILMYLASAIAYSRVYLGVHYLGDVLFGALLGLIIFFFLIAIWKRFDFGPKNVFS